MFSGLFLLLRLCLKVALKLEVAMDLPLRNLTVMSIIEDENTQAWLLLRDSQYHCEIESEKVLKTEMTDREDERLDENKMNPDILKEEIWIGTWELLKRMNFRFKENEMDHNNTIDMDRFKVPYCV